MVDDGAAGMCWPSRAQHVTCFHLIPGDLLDIIRRRICGMVRSPTRRANEKRPHAGRPREREASGWAQHHRKALEEIRVGCSMGPDNREEEHEMRQGERDEAEPETCRRAQSTTALRDKVPRARIARAPTLLRPCRLLETDRDAGIVNV